jgi:hypothetical protein
VPKNNKLSPELIEHWPEVFEYIEINAIPVKYLDGILVNFSDGTKYTIEIDDKKVADEGLDILEEALEDFFDEFDDEIESIEFSLDAKKVKQDVQNQTKKFMKKRK